jgi:hypothetical protein
LSSQHKAELIDYIEKQSQSKSGRRLSSEVLRTFIQQAFSINYHQNSIYKLLKSLNITWTTSRSKHPQQSGEAQKHFKKLQIAKIKLIPGHIALDKVNFWFQNDARIDQQNTTTRLWSMEGRRPSAVKQQQFDYAYLFGAVYPSTGETEALIVPHVDKCIRTQHLEQISAKTALGRHAVVIIDGIKLH